MKSGIYSSVTVAVLLLAVLLQTASAQQALPFGGAPAPVPLSRNDPNDPFGQRALTQSQVTLAPAPPRPGDPVGAVPMIVDPTTGLPAPAPEPVWIDPTWAPPAIILTNLNFDNLPLSEVARQIQDRFKGNFDVLPLPNDTGTGGKDWNAEMISLKLTTANAVDLINVMNLVFENDNTPVRWQLKVTGDHAYMILKRLPAAASADAPKMRRIFFVGDLLGEGKAEMTMPQLTQTISGIWETTYGLPADNNVQFHQETQLMIFTGDPEQIVFMQQILDALKQRSQWTRFKLQSQPQSNNPFQETKPAAAK